MTLKIVTQLGVLLTTAEAYESCQSLFLPMDEQWSIATTAVVANLDDIDDPDAEAVDENGRAFQYALGFDTLADIVINARRQMMDATAEQLLEAFLYYYDHDAFIDFGKAELKVLPT